MYMRKTGLRTWLVGMFMLFVSITLQAAKVDTLAVYSEVMKRKIEVIVVVPEKQQELAASVYLLHGYTGDARNWIDKRTDLPEVADRFNLLFVCPDGENSWYWDSPKDPGSQFETFVSKELVNYIQKQYAVEDNPNKRAISGLSMGGHGALWLAIRHPEVFGVAGSMSGGLDICPFPDNWEMKKQLGEMDENPDVWAKHSVINLVETMESGKPQLIIDCGSSDFFLGVNRAIHQKMLDRKIAHDFIIRPGGHEWPYWVNSLDYHLLFFLKHFKQMNEV